MISRKRIGYVKITLEDGTVLPGESDSTDPAHKPSDGWIAVYFDEGEPGIPGGIGGAAAATNKETGRVHNHQAFQMTFLKEGYSNASIALVKAFFMNTKIKELLFHKTKKKRDGGEEVTAFEIKATDGAFKDVEYGFLGSSVVDALEWVSVVASTFEFEKKAVDTTGSDDDQRKVGKLDYRQRKFDGITG